MPSGKKPSKRQIEINEVYHDLKCNVASTARHFKMTRNSVIESLFGGAVGGLIVLPDKSSPVAPPGWSSTYKTVQYNKKGVIQTWDRLRPDEICIEKLLIFLEDRTPVLSKTIKGPSDFRKDLMLEWKLFDQHHIMHSWGLQTGADYTIKHSQHLIEESARKIFGEHGPVDTCVIILGGDNMHADNRSNKTEKSGHSLDVDSRYPKGLDTFILSMVFAIDQALTKANKVVVEVLSGNHDWHTAIAISRILMAHYRKNPRVTIDPSPMEHKFFRWDTTLFMYSHGDSAPPDRYANFITNHVIRNDMTGLKRLLVRVGHIHTKRRVRPIELFQKGIAVVEYFNTLAAPDSYTTGAAFTSTRATTTDIFHRKWGKRGGMELSAEELLENFED